ncbi:hypothetical protein ACFWZY_01615 [Streptomyces sp. NPDC058992]
MTLRKTMPLGELRDRNEATKTTRRSEQTSQPKPPPSKPNS